MGNAVLIEGVVGYTRLPIGKESSSVESVCSLIVSSPVQVFCLSVYLANCHQV